jgi:hypothetical protein
MMVHKNTNDELTPDVSPTQVIEEDLKRQRDLEEGSTSVEFDEPADNDPNIVNWDGPDDPANPQNWSMKKKTVTVIIVSSVTFVT